MPDFHSGAAVERMAQNPDLVIVSSLAAVEVVNAIRLRVFRKERTLSQASQSIDAFESDIASGVLRHQPIPASAWELAKAISNRHSAVLGTRSLDILQVAIALSLRAGIFLTFDRNQAALARAEGIETPLNE